MILGFQRSDGGRAAAGFKGSAGDCVTRAIAIATGLPYRDVYDALAAGEATTKRGVRSARNGVTRKVYEPFLFDLGWTWTPTMGFGTGCTVHLRAGEIPMEGPVVAVVSKHLLAIIDGVIHDTYEDQRGGTRCVYGYYTPGPPR